MNNLNTIRNDFPNLKAIVNNRPLIYLDNAATTLKPNCVIDTITHYYQYENANVHRGIHTLSEQGTIRYEETRNLVQDFIGALSSNEIIYTKGTTESINLVASAWGEQNLQEDDVIMLTTMEHHSNIVPWQLIAKKKKARIIEIPISQNGELKLEVYKKLLEQYSKKVKMVSVVHISNTLGTVNPVKIMAKLAHEYGALFCIDAAQSIAHQKIDVTNIDCDFMAFSGHKMFAPTGIGILYGKKNLLNQMPPYQGGGAMISDVTIQKSSYLDPPHRFEAGTPHIAGVIGLGQAIKYINKIGIDAIATQEAHLLKLATNKLSQIDGIKIIGQASNKSSSLSFIMKNSHPSDIGTLLDKQGVAIRTGHHCTQPLMNFYKVPAMARASFSFYNNDNDVNTFIDAMIKVKEML